MIKNLVSVLMSCYNGEKFIKDSVKSLLKQKYRNWELIFFDNYSSDESFAEILKFDDKRIKHFKNSKHTNIGIAKQEAYNLASGEFISFLDVDDIWLSAKLENQVNFLRTNNEYSAVCSNYLVLNENKNKNIKKNKFHDFKSKINFDELFLSFSNGKPIVNNLTCLFRKKDLEKLNYVFDENLHVIADFDLILRFAQRNNIYFSKKYTSIYRIHKNNETSKTKKNQFHEINYWLNINKHNNLISNNSIYKKISINNAYEEIKILSYNKKEFPKILNFLFKYNNFKYFFKVIILIFLPKILIDKFNLI